MSIDTVSLSIIATEARKRVAAQSTVEDKLRAAMAVAHDHWMVTDEDAQFRGAIAAVLMDDTCPEDDKERIKHELTNLRSMAALLSGVPVDLSQIELGNPIGLRKLWSERAQKGTG